MSEADERNHAVFLDALEASEKAVWRIALWLWTQGYHVKINKSGAAPTRAEWEEYVDIGDLEVPQRVEVKQRSLEFTGAKDWGYPDMIVCAKHSWDRAVPKPFAYFILSKSGKTVAMIRGDSRPTWKVRTLRDRRYEGVEQQYYHAPLDQVKFFRLEEKP